MTTVFSSRMISTRKTRHITLFSFQVASATVTPADRSAEALSLAVALESAGLVHFVVRRASKDAMKMNDHTIVYKMTREVNTTVVASSPPSQQGLPRRAAEGAAVGGVAFLETVDGLEPNATYEVRSLEDLHIMIHYVASWMLMFRKIPTTLRVGICLRTEWFCFWFGVYFRCCGVMLIICVVYRHGAIFHTHYISRQRSPVD